MKDILLVLQERQERVERVRQEIWALRVAIPLLEERSPDYPESRSPVMDRPESSSNELELYYPFLRRS